jgi:hypothetical protein
MFDKMNAFADAYPAAYQTLYQAKPITCSVKGTTFDALPAPCAVVLDVSVRSTVIPQARAHSWPFMLLLPLAVF